MKLKEAAKIVATLAAAYPSARVTEETSLVYETMLADLDFEATQRACSRLIGTSEWMPTVAKIRAAVAEQTHGPRRTGEEAYAELTAAVRVHGRDYGQGVPKFADPLIASCIGVWGGWNDLCGSPSDDPGGRARFIELYDELAGRERQALSSGQRLPQPANDRPAFWLEQPRRGKETGPGNQLAAAQPVASLATALATRNQPRPKHPDPVPRRYTAEELDAAMGGAS